MKMTKNELVDIILTEARRPELNNFTVIGLPEEPMWKEPLVGFAAGGDEYFKFWKEDIGEFYWSPAEAFCLKYPGEDIRDEELTVISLAFSQTETTKKEQSKAEGRPCLRWSASRGEWEPYIRKLCTRIIAEFEKNGIRAVATDLLSEFSRKKSLKYGIATTWSHRHTAFVAGLGTFGLSDGLITRQGKAMRFSSLIVEGKIQADRRPYKKYNEWCLFYAKGTCGQCISRCPVNAIGREGHDKDSCNAFLQVLKNEISPKINTANKEYYYGCGLCQSKIPCQDGIPVGLSE